MVKKILCRKEQDLIKFGRLLGSNLAGGHIIELVGPLGAGKTTLAKAILEGSGAKGGVSPTFVLKAVYKTKHRDELKEIHHFDFYRLENDQELAALGLYDDIGRQDFALIIEWADRFPIINNQAKLRIKIKPEKNQRKLYLTAYGKKHESLLENSVSAFA